MQLKQQATNIVEHLLDNAQQHHFAGDDPFDGLNTYIFRKIPALQDTLVGLAWTQLLKRSPINFRRLVGVPKERNPKGVALFISGLLLEYQRTQNVERLEQAKELGEWLVDNMCDQQKWGAPCWGYHFPWKARAFYVPLGKPNLITTVYVSQALFELGQITEDEKLSQIALESADFIVNTLYQPLNEGDYFRYIPDEPALVHNANLWAAAWVLKSARLRGISSHEKLAHKACMTSIKAQQKDGSWPYGARAHHQFIDGFHTGYNLETLQIMQKEWQSEELQTAIDKGFEYYKQALFTPEGIAKYYHNNVFPMDTHNFMQAVLTLLKIGKSQSDLQLAESVIQQAIENLYLAEQKRFIYQKSSTVTNRNDYIRWTQGWAYYALNFYLTDLSQRENSCNE